MVAFHYSSYGTFCVHSKSSIIPTVVLPTTEIIEPIFLNAIFQKYGKLPEEYQLVGFDDSPIAREAISPITTIQQNIPHLTHTALKMLTSLIKEHKQSKGQKQTISHR